MARLRPPKPAKPVVHPAVEPFLAKRRELRKAVSTLKEQINACEDEICVVVARIFNETIAGTRIDFGYELQPGDEPVIAEPVKAEELEAIYQWVCTNSPTGYCVYDREHDGCLDSCIFCHSPYERK